MAPRRALRVQCACSTPASSPSWPLLGDAGARRPSGAELPVQQGDVLMTRQSYVGPCCWPDALRSLNNTTRSDVAAAACPSQG